MEAKDYVAAIRGHGLTQAQIAEKTGIPQPTVSKIERGEVADVMSRNYRALQTLLGELTAPKTPAPQAKSRNRTAKPGWDGRERRAGYDRREGRGGQERRSGK
jgi:transcriptional regulator with XRE-family HTH domain